MATSRPSGLGPALRWLAAEELMRCQVQRASACLNSATLARSFACQTPGGLRWSRVGRSISLSCGQIAPPSPNSLLPCGPSRDHPLRGAVSFGARVTSCMSRSERARVLSAGLRAAFRFDRMSLGGLTGVDAMGASRGAMHPCAAQAGAERPVAGVGLARCRNK